jgi:hypothetical protein
MIHRKCSLRLSTSIQPCWFAGFRSRLIYAGIAPLHTGKPWAPAANSTGFNPPELTSIEPHFLHGMED